MLPVCTRSRTNSLIIDGLALFDEVVLIATEQPAEQLCSYRAV